MAAVNVITVRVNPGPILFGFRYDDTTLLITHIGAANRSNRSVWCQVRHIATGNTRDRIIPANADGFRDISDLGLLVVPTLDPETGEIVPVPPFEFRTRTPV